MAWFGTRRSHTGTIAVAALGLTACVASVPRAGDALPGVALTANGKDVVLSWAPDSLIVRGLRPGATVEAVGEYPTSNGRVTGDPVASTRMTAGANQLRFTLADSLRSVPTGPVCLRLRVDGRTALPLRAAGGVGSSDGFQYAAWSQAVGDSSRRKVLEQEQAALESAARADKDALASFDAWRHQRGLTAAGDCESISAASVTERPVSALDVPQRLPAAQRECTWRFQRTLDSLKFKSTPQFIRAVEDVYRKALAEIQVKGAKPNSSAVISLKDTLQRIDALESIVLANLPQVSPPFKPILLREDLAFTSTTDQLLTDYYRTGKSFPIEVVPGVLDAFESCQTDSVSQFRLSHETWMREQDPRLRNSRVEAVRGECRARFADAQRRVDADAKRGGRREQIAKDLAATSTAVKSLPIGMSLIDKPCSAS